MPDAAWLPDPTGRFEYRYWDGTQWSSAVSRQGSQETDLVSTQPPPPGDPPAAEPPPPAAVAWSSDPSTTRVGAPPPPPDTANPAATPPGAVAPPAAAAAPAPATPPAGFSPPAAAARGSSSGGRTPGVADGILALGIAAIVVSIFLNWLDISLTVSGTHVTRRLTASGLPVQALVNYTTTRNDPTFLVLLIPIVVLCLVALLVVKVRWLALVGGVLAVLVAAQYSYQLYALIHSTSVFHGFGLWDFIGIGTIVCFVGGLLALVGAALPTRRR